MRTTAQFSDPSDLEISISITGSLREFEELAAAIKNSDLPYHRSDVLTRQILEASRLLRKSATVGPEEAA